MAGVTSGNPVRRASLIGQATLEVPCASRLLVATATAALTLTPLALSAPTQAASRPVAAPTVTSTATAAAPASTWTPRPEQYPGTATTKDLAIPMDDGVVLRGDLVRPAAPTARW